MSGAPAKVTRFRLERAGDGFVMRIEDDTGRLFEAIVSPDQLDMMADEIDDALLDDGSGEER